MSYEADLVSMVAHDLEGEPDETLWSVTLTGGTIRRLAALIAADDAQKREDAERAVWAERWRRYQEASQRYAEHRKDRLGQALSRWWYSLATVNRIAETCDAREADVLALIGDLRDDVARG